MVRLIKKQVMLRYDEIILYFAAAVGMFIFGIGIMTVVMFMNPEEEMFLIGTIFGIFSLIIILVAVQCTVYPIHFNLVVSMGWTRKAFFWSYLSLSFLLNAFSGILACLMGQAERAFYISVFPNSVLDIRLLNVFKIEYVTAVVVALTIVCLLLGALILKFGNKIFWAVWVVWMFICFAPLNMSKDGNTEKSMLEKLFAPVAANLSGVTEAQWIIVVIILLAAAFIGSVFLVRKQQVRL